MLILIFFVCIIIYIVLYFFVFSKKPYLIFNHDLKGHILISKIKLLQKKFDPTFYLVNPHLQTVFSDLFGLKNKIEYEREIFITKDGQGIPLDW